MRTSREVQELDADDVHIGRTVITRGLVPPGEVLDALDEKARLKERGKSITLAEILLQRGKITPDALEGVKATHPSKSTLDVVQMSRHVPTMKLVDGWWRETKVSDRLPRVEKASSEVPVHVTAGLTEHQPTLDFDPPSLPRPPEPESEDELVIIDTVPGQQQQQPSRRAPARKRSARGSPPRMDGAPKAGVKMGPWVLEKELGRGGMGVIFRARHESWGERAAVKVLRDPTRQSLVDRFTRETESMRRLEHPNIVRILDRGTDGYCPWFAMELVMGTTLSQLIREKELLPRQAVEILRVVARAVHHAHELGVLHRDLKPANVLVARDGQVKVTDFGLAKLDGDDRMLTRPGAPIGTPAYMSPEQALGGEVDRRTDVFSLGVMLFEAVSGKLPWTPERLAHLYAGGQVQLPPMKRGDKALEAIVVRATEGRPESRFESAEAFARELDAWLEGSVPSSSRLVAKLSRLRKLRRPAELVAAACMGGLVFSLAAVRATDAPKPAAAVTTSPAAATTTASAALAAAPGRSPAPAPRPFVSLPTPAPVVSAASAVPDEDQELRRVRTGRARLLAIVATLQGIESFDEKTLMLMTKKSAARIPLANISPSFLASQLTATERVDVACYLRARGLERLAAAVECQDAR